MSSVPTAFVAFLVVITIWLTPANATCVCPPGLQCNTTSNDCTTCDSGMTYVPTTGQCQPCSTCPDNSQVLNSCNATQDTQCQCQRGHYEDNGGGCIPCDLCPHGWGVSRQCTPTRNTVCRKCPPGTYSGVLSGTRGCVLCTVCKDDQVMLQECNRIQDTICVDKNNHRRHQFASSENRPNNGAQENSDAVSHYDIEPDVIPVYCTILIPIGLGLVAYFLLRWRLRYPRKTHHETGDNPDVNAFRQDALLLGSPCQQPVIKTKTTKFSATQKIRITQISRAKIHELETALDTCRLDGKDWRSLARNFGFPSGKIASFEAAGAKDRQGPTHHLLEEWKMLEGATVEALAHALVQIGREDLLWILQPTCERIFPPCQMV